MGLFIKELTEFIQSVGITLFRKITRVSALSLLGSFLWFDSDQYLQFSLLSISPQLLMSDLTFAEVPGSIFRLKKEETDKFLVTGYTNAQCALSLLKIIFPSLGAGHERLTVRIWHKIKIWEFKHGQRMWVSACWCKECEFPRNNVDGRKIPGMLTADRSHICAKTKKICQEQAIFWSCYPCKTASWKGTCDI